jgi:hypothetical protein
VIERDMIVLLPWSGPLEIPWTGGIERRFARAANPAIPDPIARGTRNEATAVPGSPGKAASTPLLLAPIDHRGLSFCAIDGAARRRFGPVALAPGRKAKYFIYWQPEDDKL